MRADFSRLSAERPESAARHYAGVLHQQGRVWLDSDWNEDVLTRLRRLEQETRDLVGPCGAPDPGTAFEILPNLDPNSQPDDFLIAGGRGPLGHYYVDGILAQLDQTASYLRQPDLPNAPRALPAAPASPLEGGDRVALVYLEVWRRLITELEDESIHEVALGGPDTATRIKVVAQVKIAALPDSKLATCAAAQKLLPRPGHGTLTTLAPQDSQPPDLCHLPDPANYTGRENHLYRVEIHDGGDVAGGAGGFASRTALGADARPGSLTLTLATPLDASHAGAILRSGLVQITDDDGQTDVVPLLGVSADGRTLNLGRGLKLGFSQARHATVAGGVARFKWSRDNAGFAVAVTAVSADRQTLTVSTLGRDQATALRKGDLVEVTDDASELGPGRGHLTLLAADPDPDLFTVVLDESLPAAIGAVPVPPASPPASPLSPPAGPPASPHLVLRRWDGWGWASATFDELGTPDMDLGDGVHIQFGGDDLRTADYWAFTARSADGSIESLTDAPPLGIIRHHCPLAIVRWTMGPSGLPTFAVVEDCRKKFPPLTRLTHLYYVSGDGQEAAPGQTLPQPLQAGVANGPWPVAGALVRFRIVAGTGTLRAGASSGADIVVATGSDGVAECSWQLDSSTPSQRVETTLVGGSALPLRYNASFADVLESGVHITDLILGVPDASKGPLRNDTNVAASVLADVGLTAICDAPIDPATISRPTCFITIEVPFPLSTLLPGSIVLPPRTFAYQTLTLDADVSANDRFIFWRSSIFTTAVLRNLAAFKAPGEPRILARLTIKGNFVWSANDPNLYLDGDAFGVRRGDATHTDIRLPSGDGRRGGDFVVWFWLLPAAQLSSLDVAPAAVIGGTTTQGTVSLSGPAPEAVPVQLASSAVTVAQVPATITVEAGQASSAPFPVRTLAQKGQATITATSGGATVSAVVTAVTLDKFTILNPAFPQPTPTTSPGGSMVGTVTLSAPAPERAVVTLEVASDPKKVVKAISPSVTIGANETAATFPVTTNQAVGSVDVKASLAGVSQTATFNTSG
jgi:hypothetical protein